MRPTTLLRLSIACLLMLVAFIIISQIVSGQPEATQATSVYNPYPPGILPAGLNAEIARVLREIDVIEERAIERWHRLPPPIVTGQPPILKNTGTERIETLGQLMNFDRRMSPGRNQACSSCHMPYAAFSGPIPSVNLTMIAYPGTAHFRAGKRTADWRERDLPSALCMLLNVRFLVFSTRTRFRQFRGSHFRFQGLGG